MDPSTPSTPNTAQPMPAVGQTQSPVVSTVPASLSQIAQLPVPPIPTQQASSGHPEQGPIQSRSAQETPDSPEDQIQPAKQETGAPNAAVQTAEIQAVEITPSMPDVAIEKNIEHVVEKSPESEQPQLSQVVKDAGITLSGPGIPVEENKFAVQKMPMTYQQAELIENTTKINESKHWLAELILYMWRKLDPMLGKKGQKK